MTKKSRTSDAPPPPKGGDIHRSRRVAGLNVGLSIGAAVLLLVAVNVISNMHSWRTDAQTLGRYGLSETAKRVLAEIDQPVRLTSIYTSTDEEKAPAKYLPRVREVLEEIERAADEVTVVNVTTDRQKKEVVDRLRKRVEEKASDHRQVIDDFLILADRQRPQYEALAQRWEKYPSAGWLGQFGTAKAVQGALDRIRDDLASTAADVRSQLGAATVPDYQAMVDKTEGVLETAAERLEQIGAGLRELSALPEKAKAARDELTRSADGVNEALTRAGRNLGAPEAELPADPSKALDQLVKDAEAVSEKALAVRRRLEKLNTDSDGYARHARAWQLRDGPLSAVYGGVGMGATNLARQAKGVRDTVKVDVQREVIKEFRLSVAELARLAKTCREQLARLMEELTGLDEPTRKVFGEVAKADYLTAQVDPIRELLGRMRLLEELEAQKELIDEINEDNIVIVEVGEDKTGVVTFDEVWPVTAQPDFGPAPPERERRRGFYGDMAICSKMLSMTAKPFAQVVLTYYEDIPPQFMWQQRRPVSGPIPSVRLTEVRQRLEQANLEVTEWNLAQDTDPPEATEGLPQVLLVLPPPEARPAMPPMGGQPPKQWGRADEARITRLIDGGTPAIFLAGHFPSGFMGAPTPYELGGYLRDTWGVDVKTAMMVVQAERDPQDPDQYEIPLVSLTWLPLSSFTDHPIGEPLKARRLYWLSVCPVVRAAAEVSNVTVEDILVAPSAGGPTHTWAVADSQDLRWKIFQGESIGPDTDAGDLLPPFPVAVHARREADGTVSRIVVLGAGLTYIDPFLREEVPRLVTGGKLAKPEPPPTGTVDLLVNSVYHLSGRDEFIGAGPSVIQPIELISPAAMTWIKVCFGLAWPLLVFAAGVAVMIVRKW